MNITPELLLFLISVTSQTIAPLLADSIKYRLKMLNKKPDINELKLTAKNALDQLNVTESESVAQKIAQYIFENQSIILSGKSSAESSDPNAEEVIGTKIIGERPVKIMPGYESSAKGFGKKIIGTQIGE